MKANFFEKNDFPYIFNVEIDFSLHCIYELLLYKKADFDSI